MFPKVPQSSLGILRVPQLTPCPWTPHLKNPRKNVFPLKGTGFTAPLEPCTFTDLTLETNTANTNTQNANRSGVFWVEGETKQTCKLRAQTNDEEKKQVWVRGLELCFFPSNLKICVCYFRCWMMKWTYWQWNMILIVISTAFEPIQCCSSWTVPENLPLRYSSQT